MSDRDADQMAWESERIEALGGALIAAASAAGIGVSLVSIEEPAPRVVYVSDKGVEILGHPREVIMTLPATAFLTPDERAIRLAPGYPRPTTPGARFFETIVQRADGSRVPVEVSLANIRLDGRPGMITFTRDISERREAVAALERSERRFRQLIEIAPDAVWINDGRRLVFANPAAARMLKYDTVEELLKVDPRQIVVPDDHQPMRERTQQMFQTGVPLPPREYKSRAKDGTIFITEVQAMPMEWEGSQALLGFARDVTERKEMEARLAQSERLAALGTLLAGIAHEMNNPLSYTLLGIEQAIATLDHLQAPPPDLARLRETLESAHHGATRVASVIGQIRASSRLEAEDRGPVDVRAAVEAALRVTHNEIHHRARLVTDISDVPRVAGNAQRLEQVFLNLLVNAVQALPDGRAENEIRVSVRANPAGQVVVDVTDNGAGVPDDVRSRIFDPFFTTKPVGLGVGLGLSICHGIVSAHGGTIAVESVPGRGSTFRVALPAERADASPSPPAARPRGPGEGEGGKKRRRVLVIDDEPALSSMIRRVLSRDCDVEIAGDGREGLQRLEKDEPYDVVLCDLMMPDMTGMDVYAEIAQRRPGMEERFVFMTGGAFTPRATDFLAQVPNRRLEKPFETAVLRAIVNSDPASSE
jgi:PAS domain S-box-containing protein